MNSRTYTLLVLVLLLWSTARSYAGISVSSPGAINGTFVIYYGLGSPLPGKVAYVSVAKPNGTHVTIGQAENVSDYSQVCFLNADMIGSYRFYYEYSHYSQGVPRTTVFYQDYYIPPPPADSITWQSATAPSPSEPNSTVTIAAGFYNPGPSTWATNHYIEFQDYYGTPLYYVSINGHPPGTSGSRTGNVTLPNIGGIGTATYYLRAIHGNVGYFGAIQPVPIVIDYRPWAELSAPSSAIIDQPITVAASAGDPYLNLTAHALDYKPPGGTWVYGSNLAGTRWDGTGAGSSYLSLSLMVSTAGNWEFHTRSADSYGQLSDPQSKVVNVVIPVPSCTISANAATIASGSPVTLTVNATNARYINIDQVSPNSGFYGNVSSGDEFPPGGAHYDLGTVQANPPRNLVLTLHTLAANPGAPVTYTFKGAVSAGAGWYDSSNQVTVTVTPATTAPVFTSHPVSTTVTAGSSASFTASATGNPNPTYQWQRNVSGSWSNLSNGGTYSGVTTTTLTISGTSTTMTGDQFRCIAANSGGSVASGTAALTVTGGAGDMTTGLVGWWKLDEGAGQIASDSAGGNPGAVNGPNWIGGRIGSGALSFDGSDDYVYVSGFTWAGGPVTVAFWNYVPTTPSGYTSAFGVDGSNGTNRFQAHVPWTNNTLYWDYGNINGAGRITADYSPHYGKWTHVTLVSAGESGSFKAIYLDGALVASSGTSDSPGSLSGLRIGSFVESGATYHSGSIDDFRIYTRVLSQADVSALFTYTAATTVPVITTQPQSQTITIGATATFTVSATGTPAPGYQWRKNGANIAGATASSYSITNAQPGDAGTYSVIVSNSAGSATSSDAILTVNATSTIAWVNSATGTSGYAMVTGEAGLRFMVGETSLAMTAVGFQRSSGTYYDPVIRVRNSSGVLATITVPYSSVAVGEFAYAELAAPLMLDPGGIYWITFDAAGYNGFNGFNTDIYALAGVTTTSDATLLGCADANGNSGVVGALVNFKYGSAGGGSGAYSLTVVNGTGSASGLSAGATRTITAMIPSGALFTGWEISGPGTILVSRLAVTRTLTMGAGNVTATATYQYPGAEPLWFDVNDDGIRDEVAPRGVLGFDYAIDEIWTTYDYESENWDIFFDWWEQWWPGGFTIDNFPNIWLNYRPPQITNTTTWLYASAVFDGEVGEQYGIMGWNGSSGYWGNYGSIALGPGDNLNPIIYFPSFLVEDFLAFKFVRARVGLPAAGVQINLPILGPVSLRTGTGGVSGTVTLPGGVKIDVTNVSATISKAGAGSVTISGGTISGSIDLGGDYILGGVVNGNVGLTTPTGVAISAGPGGTTLSIPNGPSVIVTGTGVIAMSVPAGSTSTLTNAVNLLGNLLGIGPIGPTLRAKVVPQGSLPNAIIWESAAGLVLGDRAPGVYDVGVTTDEREQPADNNIVWIKVTIVASPPVFITPAGNPVTAPVEAGSDPNSIPDGANEFTYSLGNPGVLTIKLKARIPGLASRPVGEQASYRFVVSTVGDSTMAWDAANPFGQPTINGEIIEAKVTFSGLPTNNSAFGAKTARLVYGGVPVVDQPFEVFFPTVATNHPDGQPGSENWFYYWMQTPANKTAGAPTVYNSGPSSFYSFKTEDKIYIGTDSIITIRPLWGDPKGIDGFAWYTAHEAKHRSQMMELWPHGYQQVLDQDTEGVIPASGIGDDIPGSAEPIYIPGRAYNPTKFATYADDLGYGQSPLPDREDINIRSRDNPSVADILWINGDANSSDWSNPGKNSKDSTLR